jgi:acyl-CoA thioesterase YciA|tara:strand:- start:46 stop:456 length:411 start_codon:yes stop_codon:yes gene_type:complete
MDLISTHKVMTQHLGYHGNLFGGQMLAWIDEAGVAFASEACGTPQMVTVHMSEVRFNAPVRPTQIIKIYGKIEKMGTSSVTLRIEARRHSVYNGTQKTVCSTQITFVRIDGDGEAVPIPDHLREKWFVEWEREKDE